MNEQDQIIGSFFDDCANEGIMACFDDQELAKLDAHLGRWDIRPGDRILEPGCGSGRLTAILAERVGKSGEVVSYDISKEMISRARQRNLPPWVQLYHGSAAAMPFPDGWFDKVLCFQVFPHFTDRPGTLTEFHRVLKLDGTLWIAHLSSRESINELHRNSGDAIISHMIPDEATMHELLTGADFSIDFINDTATCYWVRAHRK